LASRTLTILSIIILFLSCETQKVKSSITYDQILLRNPEVYIFLGHSYASGHKVDKRIGKIWQTNHHYWLGGDICQNTTNEVKIFQNLDKIFDIKDADTHWALGNHDFHKTFKPIKAFTGKPEYYATYIKGITLLVMNSNIMENGFTCEEKRAQTDFIASVLDTVESSSHLIVMSHHIFWGRMNEDTAPVKTYANTDHSGRMWKCNPKLTAADILYPKLEEIMKKEIQVILLAGDMGQKQSAYEYRNENGIMFLGNGGLSDILYNNEKFPKASTADSVLVFTHYPDHQLLKWKFINVGN